MFTKPTPHESSLAYDSAVVLNFLTNLKFKLAEGGLKLSVVQRMNWGVWSN